MGVTLFFVGAPVLVVWVIVWRLDLDFDFELYLYRPGLLGLALAFVAGALFLVLKLKLRKGRRLGGVVVISAPHAEAAEDASPERTDKPEPPETLIANIEAVSQNAKGIYFIYIGLLAFCALTVAGSSDRQIILNEPATLPIINVDVSMDGFFILAPLLSIFFFIYFQIYLNKSRRLFHKLRTKYKKIEEDERIYPWMINFADEPDAGPFVRFIVNASVWWSMPVVLMLLASWYLKKHDPFLGSVVGLTPLAGMLVVLSFWARPPGQCFKLARAQRTLLGLVLLFEIYFFGVFMPRALRGERLIGTWPAVDVAHQNLMSKPDEQLGKEVFKTLYRVNLGGVQLQGADFTGAILNKANLRGANLKRARLRGAYLQGADFREAIAEAADLTNTDLRKAVFRDVRVDSRTLLAGAKLDSTDIRGMDVRLFSPNQLQKAVFALESLRAESITNLSSDSARAMILKRGFFHSLWNPKAMGFDNEFELQQNGQVVVDPATGLWWQQSPSAEPVLREDALEYIRKLNEKKFAGYKDWRLPTLEETMSLMEPHLNVYALCIDPLFDRRQMWIWTADKLDASLAWVVDFSLGRCMCRSYPVDDLHFVRAVR